MRRAESEHAVRAAGAVFHATFGYYAQGSSRRRPSFRRGGGIGWLASGPPGPTLRRRLAEVAGLDERVRDRVRRRIPD